MQSAGFRASMSRRADCYDNAPMESFFHTLKTELVHHQHYATKEQAKRDIFAYIEGYYNRTGAIPLSATPARSRWSKKQFNPVHFFGGRSCRTHNFPGFRFAPSGLQVQFFSTIRPTTLPARNSSIHFCTSAIGSSRIGVGLILPARASAINSCAS